jgi:hypothetical protein
MKMSLLKKITASMLLVVLTVGITACRSKSSNDKPATSATVTLTEAASTDSTTPEVTATTPPKNQNATTVPITSIAPPTFTSTGVAKVTIEDTKLMVGDNELWINGVNTPWDRWNDFGSPSFNEDFWEEHFAKLEAAGVNASRVWINCNSMVGVYLNDDGSFMKVTDKHWQDLDTLFSIAEKHHIYIMATLLSFDHFKDSNQSHESWRAMVTSSDNIDSFVNGYIIPFVERYDSCDYLWSIDLINEPDWVHENKESGQISWDNLSNYFARACAGIHENSDVLVTVGLGMIKYNSDTVNENVISDSYLSELSGNENSYVDFYSTHYYYWQNEWFGFPFEKSPTDFGLDGTKPNIIGEVASVDESGRTITEKYEGAYNHGWNGVMAWTSNGVDACGGFDDVLPAITRMYELIPNLIHPLQ